MSDEFLPYGRQLIDEDDIAAVAAVLRSDWLTTGPAVEAFEQAVSDVSGGHPVVAVNSGTAALHAAYAAVGAGPGTNIVTTPLTFASTATAALHLGAEVRFADVDDETLLIDPAKVAELVDDNTVAIVPVDLAGQPSDVDALRPIAESVGALIIQDAAHSIGGRDRDRPVGDIADLTCFSFHPVKTVTTGEGGAVVVKHIDHLDAVRRFRSHGLVRDVALMAMPDEGAWHQEVHSLGLNYRMPDILAALGTSQLRKLDRFVARRAEIVERYRTELANLDKVRLLGTRDRVEPGWHLAPIRVLGGRRRAVFDALRGAGIGVQVHYLPVYRHPLMARLGFEEGTCPVAETAYEELISLPLHPGLTDSDQRRVIEVIRSLTGATRTP